MNSIMSSAKKTANRYPLSWKLLALALFLPLGALLGCGGVSATVPALVLVVPPNSTTVEAGSTTFVMASAVPVGVIWSLSGSGCSGAACGTLTGATQTSVNYVAPQSFSGNSLTVTLTATSSTASSISSSVTFTVVPVSVSITPLASDVIAPGASITLAATLTNDLSGEGVAWSVSCSASACGSFSNSTETTTTYTAPSGVSGLAISITAASVADPAASATINLSIPELSDAIQFSPRNLPAAVVNQPYHATVAVSGGTAPYSITATGVPSWMTMSTTADSITFSGTPASTDTGSSTIQLVAVDSSTPVALTNIASMIATVYSNAPTGNALLNGSYAFYASGWQDAATLAATQRVALIGSLTADGNGNITGGEMDVNSATGLISYSLLTGTYDLQSNQTGTITLVPSGTQSGLPITLAVSLGGVNNGTASTGNFIEYDDATGIGAAPTGGSSGTRFSGSLALQSASVLEANTTPFTGSFAFGMSGGQPAADANSTCETVGCPVSLAGAVTFGSGAAITSGVEDVDIGKSTSATSGIALTGQMDSSGATDASGRATGTITAANTSLGDWPSGFILYMVTPKMFYIMSADSFDSETLLVGEGLQQNLADIASTPFTASEPVMMYGNVFSTLDYPTPKGSIRAELQMLTATPTSATAGSLKGPQIVNASGTWSPNSSISKYTYTVQPTGRVAVSGNNPAMYLIDTNTGFATSYGSTPAGLFYFEPRTSTSLNAGTYSFGVFSQDSEIAPLETGTLTIPSGGVTATASDVNVIGEIYASFSEMSADESNSAGTLLFNEPLTGTLSNASGTLTPSLSSGIQGCTSGEGYVISATKFACITGVHGQGYPEVHVFEQ